jgi:hypothetical protein
MTVRHDLPFRLSAEEAVRDDETLLKGGMLVAEAEIHGHRQCRGDHNHGLRERQRVRRPLSRQQELCWDIRRHGPYDREMLLAQSGDSLEIHHPLLRQLLDLWNVKRGQRAMPARADFDVFELRDWLGNLMLVDVLEGAREFRYRLYGTILASYYGRDLTGRSTAALAPETRDIVCREYGEVCVSRSPMMVERKRSVRHSARIVAKLILPLSTDDRDPDMLLIASYVL